MPQGSESWHLKFSRSCSLSQALRVTGDRRRAHVPDAAQAWAGGQRGGKRAPTPLAGRCAPWLDERSFIRAVCCRVASRASAPAQAASGPAGEAGGRAALPCVPWQPHAAAGCGGVFLPPQEAQGNPGGATSRLGASALPIARNGSPLDMALSARIEEAREGGRKLCFRPACVNLAFPWPTVILIPERQPMTGRPLCRLTPFYTPNTNSTS